MSKGGSSQTTTTAVDPQTQRWQDLYRQSAAGVAGSGLGPWAPPGLLPYWQGQGASQGQPRPFMGGSGNNTQGGWGSAWNVGGGGSHNPYAPQPVAPQGGPGGPGGPGAFPGIPDWQSNPYLQQGQQNLVNLGMGNVSGFEDPYQQQVINASMADFARQRQQVGLQSADMATQQHAYGGDRAAILQAQGLNDVNRSEAGTLANLRSQGYADSFNRLGSTVGPLLNLGMTQREDQWNRALQSLGLMGNATGLPSQTQSTPLQGNKFGSVLGGAGTGFAIAGPPGAAIGGLGGLLFG